jgi:hypothetical protein
MTVALIPAVHNHATPHLGTPAPYGL